MNNFKIRPRISIAEEVYQLLRLQILTGEIRARERLNVAKLAEDLDVSRTPVRESLSRLEMEKLVSSVKPKGGYLVRGITEEDVAEICDIRMVNEALAAKWAASKITSEELNRLDEIVLLVDRGIEENDTSHVAELDTEFHDIICRASRSTRIEEIAQALRDHMLIFRIKALCIPEIARKSNEGHRRIARALRNKDLAEIDSAFAFHLSVTKREVTEVLRNE